MATEVTHTTKLLQFSTNSKEKSQIFDDWEIDGFEIMHAYESKKKCFCGEQSRNICYIRNKATNKEVPVALECAERFNKESEIYNFLKSVLKIFDGCNKILENISNSASYELVEFAYKKNFFTETNKVFYDENAKYIWSTLPQLKQKYRNNLNLILIAMVSSAKLGFQRLDTKQTNIAAPRLIEHAFEQEILTISEKKLYLNLWKRMNIPFGINQSLNADEKKTLMNLHDKMITKLKPEFLRLPGGQQRLSKFFGQPTKRSGIMAVLGSPPPKSGKRKRDPKV